MLIIEEAIEKFNNDLPEEIRLSCSAPEVIKPLRLLESAYDINLSTLIIYFAIGELQFEDISDYIETEYNFNDVKAHALSREIEETILKPLLDRVNFINSLADKEMTLEQEKTIVAKMFQSNLMAEMLRPSIITDAVNQRILSILARELNFQNKLEQAMYENTETITKNPIIINGQSVKPSIANWLKDYISQYGSQTHDSMSQSAFLINSENAKNITLGERELLAKILKTYINIKFFPESMPSDNGEGWEIIPVDDTIETEKSATITSVQNIAVKTTSPSLASQSQTPKPLAKIPTAPPLQKNSDTPKPKISPVTTSPKVAISTPTPVKKPITPLPKPPAKTPPMQSVRPSPITQPTISADSSDELLSLKNMLLQYPPHSLEREAIEEEIKKIEKS